MDNTSLSDECIAEILYDEIKSLPKENFGSFISSLDYQNANLNSYRDAFNLSDVTDLKTFLNRLRCKRQLKKVTINTLFSLVEGVEFWSSFKSCRYSPSKLAILILLQIAELGCSVLYVKDILAEPPHNLDFRFSKITTGPGAEGKFCKCK